MIRGIAATVGSTFLWACGSSSSELLPPFSVRDSSGVEIVTSHGSQWAEGEAWRLSVEPLVGMAGIGDPVYEFHMVHDALKLGDGRLAVAAGGAREIRLYDAEGAYLTTLGRRGEGPGEFTALTRVWPLPGDSIMSYDRRLRRVSIFAPGGEFVRSFGFTVLEGGSPIPTPVGPMDGGRFLVLQRAIIGAYTSKGSVADSAFVLAFDMEGNLRDTLAFAPERETYVNDQHGRLWTSPAPFGPVSSWAVSGDGFFFGSGRFPEIESFDARGTLRRIIRWTHQAPQITQDHIDLYKESLLGAGGSPQILAWVGAVAEDMMFPRTMPDHGPLQVDTEGNLWVERFFPPGAPVRTWHVFDPSGALLGPVEMPAALKVYEIGTDYVLGQWIDEMNVQTFRLYGLIKDVRGE